ncbi:hypothetical protein FAM09_02605 [Niastella caeni]|uniref:TIGR04222 domain-containing membrane protein n=1 Tax=Niastella caeni TaxID=2569763 RepID=A0A4S8HZL5_9BACT|nr:hypothetical protein [Niastella caeni]THU41025.1 hypothetical protein FAM09_02605 [Niastella caeni]
MKIEEHSGLWSAIQQFPLDDPNAEITFSSKLSAKQKWSPTFTERVVEEYRKFIFLCCISPNGASPSQAVDEAWHLHLTYTKSYWIDLCKNTLGKDIHHYPSRGGDEEDHKHLDWYAATLTLYQSVFESPPPNDIWPPPPEYELIPEPTWSIRNEVIALILMLLLFTLTVSAYLHKDLFPFSLDGPQFLVFFPLLAITCIICYVILQNEKGRALHQLVTTHFPTDATVYQLAQFLYGKHRAVQTAIVDLVRRNLLGLTSDKQFIVYRNRYYRPDNEQNPLIAGFLNEESSSVTYDMIACNWYNDESNMHPVLQKLYLLAYHKEPFFKRYHLLMVPYAVGIARLFQGLANGKDVGYLFWEMVLLVLASMALTKMVSRKAIIFKKVEVLARLQQDVGSLYGDKLVGEFAMDGNDAINWFSDGIVLAGIFSVYPVIDHTKAANVTGSCSSCSGGGGGCSGGGGGGCGGGCGGCGGGD